MLSKAVCAEELQKLNKNGGKGVVSEIRTISVVGLGLMGTPIATLLMKAGYSVCGFDVIERQISDLVSLGLRPAKSPEDAARGADLMILSLPTWDAVTEVMEGKDGILKAAREGQVVIDTSTSPPWESKAMAEKAVARGIEWMDVPISGSSAQVKVGNMVFMAGGKKTVFDKVKPVLDRIGKKTIYVGKHGDGAAMKLVINHTLYLNEAAAIEGLVLGLKAGLDPDILFNVITSGAASSDLLLARGRDMLAGNFAPKGPTRLAIKDLRLSLETGRQLGVMLPVGSLYLQFLLQAQFNGWERDDATVVMRIYEQLAGVKRAEKKPSSKDK